MPTTHSPCLMPMPILSAFGGRPRLRLGFQLCVETTEAAACRAPPERMDGMVGSSRGAFQKAIRQSPIYLSMCASVEHRLRKRGQEPVDERVSPSGSSFMSSIWCEAANVAEEDRERPLAAELQLGWVACQPLDEGRREILAEGTGDFPRRPVSSA